MGTKHVPHHFSKKNEEHLEEIGDYMKSPPISVDVKSSVKEAAEVMHDKLIGSLLIKDGEEFVGIMTETDISRKVVATGLKADSTPVSEVMTHPILSMDIATRVEQANIYMANHKVRHLGVTRDDKIVGILSVRDLVSFFANPRMRTW